MAGVFVEKGVYQTEQISTGSGQALSQLEKVIRPVEGRIEDKLCCFAGFQVAAW